MRHLKTNSARYHSVIASILFLLAGSASASYQLVEVGATAGPWNWESGGLNDGYQYGPEIPDFTAPVRVKLSDIGVSEGSDLYLTYIDGLTSAYGGPPVVNNNGYVGSFKDGDTGNSDEVFPSNYLPDLWGIAQDPADPDSYGVFLQSLLGAMTDDTGNIVSLFSLGNVIRQDDGNGGYTQGFVFGLSFSVPAGATYVQFGFNDDIFTDNTGSLQVCVSGADDLCQPAPVPVPAALWLFASGLAGVCASAVRRCRGRPV